MFRQNKISRILSPAIAMALLAPAGFVPMALAQQSADEVEQIVVTGSRGRPRTVSDSPVPIDVFSASDIEAIGQTDMNEIIKVLVPSFNTSRWNPDGAAMIRPVELRGLPFDKTLVLVNSKRRHRAALVSWFNTGAQGPDMAQIPAAAIQNIEVLRDGAAAQYGSDAIAGVINFLLKENREGMSFTVETGTHFEGDGDQSTLQGNIGLPLGDNGFLSLTGEYYDQELTNRGDQYCRTAFSVDSSCGDTWNTFIANGDADRVAYALSPEYQAAVTPGNPNFPNLGDGSKNVMQWGNPEQDALRLFFNAGIDLDDDSELYAFGNYSDSEANSGFFYRFPFNGTNEDLREPDGSIYNPLEIFPGGFSPRLFGTVKDSSVVAGWRGNWDNGLSYDFSARTGESKIEYVLKNTINASMGPQTPTAFDLGDLTNTETQLQADFTYELDSGPLLAFGVSWMDESYDISPGGPNSYGVGPYAVADPHGFCNDDGTSTAAGSGVIAAGSTLDCANGSDPVYRAVSSGSNGFVGQSPRFADDYERQSAAVYADVSHSVTENLFLQAALRYEDYDDFDAELVWKLAGKLDVTENFGIRASVGTAFRAPTPGQQATTFVTTRLPDGIPLEGGLFPAGGPVAAALGASPLKPELSNNYTIGFTAQMANVDLTVDFYRIDIEDRMFPTSPQPVSTDSTSGSAYDNFLALQGAGVESAAFLSQVNFFASAFDSTTEGVDIVASTPIDWGNNGVTTLTASASFNESEFDSPESQVSNFLNAEARFDFENLLPKWKGVISARHEINNFSIVGRVSYFGEFDNFSRGDIQTYGANWFTDIEGQYQINDTIGLSIGARNVFDEYPDKDQLADACCGDLYYREARTDWQGGYYYGRLTIGF